MPRVLNAKRPFYRRKQLSRCVAATPAPSRLSAIDSKWRVVASAYEEIQVSDMLSRVTKCRFVYCYTRLRSIASLRRVHEPSAYHAHVTFTYRITAPISTSSDYGDMTNVDIRR